MKTKMKPSKPRVINILNLLKTPPVRWRAKFGKFSLRTCDVIEHELEHAAMVAASMAAYVRTLRGTDGTGPKDHLDAVKEMNKVRCKVRKALGFTVPNANTISF